jgi:hypothetical protein
MDQYPPGFYVSEGKKGLPTPGPGSVLQAVEVDAGPLRVIPDHLYCSRESEKEETPCGSGGCTLAIGTILSEAILASHADIQWQLLSPRRTSEER